jgi:hypothetical protein
MCGEAGVTLRRTSIRVPDGRVRTSAARGRARAGAANARAATIRHDGIPSVSLQGFESTAVRVPASLEASIDPPPAHRQVRLPNGSE